MFPRVRFHHQGNHLETGSPRSIHKENKNNLLFKSRKCLVILPWRLCQVTSFQKFSEVTFTEDDIVNDVDLFSRNQNQFFTWFQKRLKWMKGDVYFHYGTGVLSDFKNWLPAERRVKLTLGPLFLNISISPLSPTQKANCLPHVHLTIWDFKKNFETNGNDVL
jgi:hypothetical protein